MRSGKGCRTSNVFISAREALLKRNKDPTSSPRTGFAEGHEQRLAAFDKFEHEFETCISQSAVQTKFEQHTNRGKGITTLLCETTANIANKSQTYKEECVKKIQHIDEENTRLEHELRSMTEATKDKIRHITEDVKVRVAETLKDEIKRLYTLIDEFDRPFSPDPEQIPLYKRDLHRWVEDRLGSNLQSRLHSALYASLDKIHRDIKERAKGILVHEDRKKDVDAIPLPSNFAVSYRLDCSNLCSDFREDIQFKFSLGFTSLWQRFVQTQKESLTGSKNSNELTSPPSSSSLISSTNELLTTANNISALTSKSGIIVLGASAFIWRGVGWKVVGVVAGIYAGLYLYERLMWTKKAQERAFKRQYADFTSSKMKLVVDMTSGNASFQVQQELSKYFAQTLQFIDIEKDALADQMRQTRIEMDQLSKYIEKGKVLKKQGDQIDRQISEFSKQYLSSDVPSNQ